VSTCPGTNTRLERAGDVGSTTVFNRGLIVDKGDVVQLWKEPNEVEELSGTTARAVQSDRSQGGGEALVRVPFDPHLELGEIQIFNREVLYLCEHVPVV